MKNQLKIKIQAAFNILPEALFFGSLIKLRSKRTRDINGFKMTLDTADGGIGGALWTVGHRERAFMHLLGTEIESGSTVVDLGANIGYTALQMCGMIGSSGHLIAIEPDARNIKQLNTNLKHNGFAKRTEVHQLAISDHKGSAEFFLSDQPNLNAMQTGSTTIASEHVAVESLDTFFENRTDFPSFIKMDVEGHEVEILDGGFELFSNRRDPAKILIEVHPDTYDESHSFEQQLRRYREIGFEVKYVVSTPVAVPPQFAEKGYEPSIQFETDGRVRGIYENVSFEDCIDLATRNNRLDTDKEVAMKVVRSIMIARD
jgi:FkbM family methyltransferase